MINHWIDFGWERSRRVEDKMGEEVIVGRSRKDLAVEIAMDRIRKDDERGRAEGNCVSYELRGSTCKFYGRKVELNSDCAECRVYRAK